MKQLLMVGGGHAHVHVLDAQTKSPFPDTAITLISPYPRQIYSGMLPGWIAGDYSIDQCAVPIDQLARRGGVRFVETTCIHVDLEHRQAHCANGEIIAFDFVSIDSGPTVANSFTSDAPDHVIPSVRSRVLSLPGRSCWNAPGDRPLDSTCVSWVTVLQVRSWHLPSGNASSAKASAKPGLC